MIEVGFLYYGNNSYAVEIDDRPLAHLKVTILSALRAGRSLAFSFERSTDMGSGRETLWISPASEIRFRFNGSRSPRINDEWLKAMMATATSSTGLRLVKEPDEAGVLRQPVG